MKAEFIRGTPGYRAPAAAVVAAILLVVLGLIVAQLQASYRGPVICPFRAVTGLPCPTCGLLRTAHSLVHGRIGAAFRTNPFDALFLTIVAPVGLLFWFANLTKGIAVRISTSRRERVLLWWILGAVVAANWIYVLTTDL